MSVIREYNQLIFLPFVPDHVNAFLYVAHKNPLTGRANADYLIWNVLEIHFAKHFNKFNNDNKNQNENIRKKFLFVPYFRTFEEAFSFRDRTVATFGRLRRVVGHDTDTLQRVLHRPSSCVRVPNPSRLR